MNTILVGKNVKGLREERNITQQQLADALGISFQSISKWECNISTPDIAMLPEIADYFEVTIDSLFSESDKVYKHKAERLVAKYESDTENSGAFYKADNEYEKLFASGGYDHDDISSYAYLNDLRMGYYARKAEKHYLDAIEKGESIKDDEYYYSQTQYILFLSKLGRAHERIELHKELLQKEPDVMRNHLALSVAYYYSKNYDDALTVCKHALELFPHDPVLLQFIGDIYNKLKQYDKAVECWKTACEIDSEMVPALYSLAFYYRDNGYTNEAISAFNDIIVCLEQNKTRDGINWLKSEIRKLKANNG